MISKSSLPEGNDHDISTSSYAVQLLVVRKYLLGLVLQPLLPNLIRATDYFSDTPGENEF